MSCLEWIVVSQGQLLRQGALLPARQQPHLACQYGMSCWPGMAAYVSRQPDPAPKTLRTLGTPMRSETEGRADYKSSQ